MRIIMFVIAVLLLGLGAWKIPQLDIENVGELAIAVVLVVAVAGQFVAAGFATRSLKDDEPFFSSFTIWSALGAGVFIWIVYNIDVMEKLTPESLQLLMFASISFLVTNMQIGLLWPREETVEEAADDKEDSRPDDEEADEPENSEPAGEGKE